MSKAVLISIRPKWCELIANGTKTVEVRKSRPKLHTPFKCYIYCTRGKHLAFMQSQTGTNLIACMDVTAAIPVGGAIGNGKVIGEFTCYSVTNLFSNSMFWLDEDDILHTCLSVAEMRKYANGANGLYGWHISDLKIYDKPRELREFKKSNRDCFYADLGLAKRDCPDCKDPGCILERPPQSWCYVEGG